MDQKPSCDVGHARAVERKGSKKENMESMEGNGGGTDKRKREKGKKNHIKVLLNWILSLCIAFVSSNWLMI